MAERGPMAVRVELFGICRERAGAAEVDASGHSLGEVLNELGARYPRLAADCIEGGSLRPGYIANLRGERFVSDPATPLDEGDWLLLMSIDAGG